VFIEAAQSLGKRMRNEISASSDSVKESNLVAQRIRHGFRLSMSRIPSERESKILRKLYNDAFRKYLKQPIEALKLIGEVDSLVDQAQKVTHASEVEQKADEAALVTVARAILNLDEFMTRE
jgi:hypothetical protein